MLKRKVLIVLLASVLIWQFSLAQVEKAYAADQQAMENSQVLADESGTNEVGDGMISADREEGSDNEIVSPETNLTKTLPDETLSGQGNLKPSLPVVKDIESVSDAPEKSNQVTGSSLSPQASAGDVVINELMWMGSTQSSSDEWVELKNMTNSAIDFSANNWSIYKNDVLMLVIDSGTLEANSYFLISNYNDDSVNSLLNVTPDLVDSAVSLSNSAVDYKLYDAGDDTGNLIDTADRGTGTPLAGINQTDKKFSMERNLIPGDGTLAVNWHTANKSVGFDVTSVNEKGTPKTANSQTPIFVSVTSDKKVYKNGDVVTLTVKLNQNNYQVSADFSLLDDQYNLGDEKVVNNNDNTYTFTYTISNSNGLADATGLNAQVKADDEINLAVVDNSLFVELDNTSPAMPQNLRVVTGEGFVYLSWNLVLDADHYEIWRSGSFVFLGTTIDTFYRDISVVGGKKYTYQVIAVDKVGNKSLAVEISVTPPVIIIAPETEKIIYSYQEEVVAEPQIAAAVVEKEPVKEVEQAPAQDEGSVQGEETEEEEAPTNWPLIIGIALAGLVVVFWVYYWYISWKESKPKTRRKK